MKRLLILTTVLSAAILSQPAMAQTERRLPTAAVQRPALDTAALAQRLRAQGLPDAAVDANIARIRAALASGQYPHLQRRLYNAQNPADDNTVARRRIDAVSDADGNPRRRFNAATDDDNDARRRFNAATIDRPVDRGAAVPAGAGR